MVAEAHNEIARLRASYHAVQGGKSARYEPFAFVDPRIERAKAKEAVKRAELTEAAEEDLFAGLDW